MALAADPLVRARRGGGGTGGERPAADGCVAALAPPLPHPPTHPHPHPTPTTTTPSLSPRFFRYDWTLWALQAFWLIVFGTLWYLGCIRRFLVSNACPCPSVLSGAEYKLVQQQRQQRRQRQQQQRQRQQQRPTRKGPPMCCPRSPPSLLEAMPALHCICSAHHAAWLLPSNSPLAPAGARAGACTVQMFSLHSCSPPAPQHGLVTLGACVTAWHMWKADYTISMEQWTKVGNARSAVAARRSGGAAIAGLRLHGCRTRIPQAPQLSLPVCAGRAAHRRLCHRAGPHRLLHRQLFPHVRKR